ncbi:unnamed protein product, partial [Phaeothamnion confervicola]
DCEGRPGAGSACVVDDTLTGAQCVELMGEAALRLPCSSVLPFLCLHLDAMGEFVSFEVTVVDDAERFRRIDVSNRRSQVVLDGDLLQLPLKCDGPGWERLNLDLDRIVRLAFGTQYLTTCLVRVGATCRLARVFFQEQPYADVALPPHLRVMQK